METRHGTEGVKRFALSLSHHHYFLKALIEDAHVLKSISMYYNEKVSGKPVLSSLWPWKTVVVRARRF
ncbi:hypothetical protein E2C01_006007 [Portunus trituberculatus]|uniref:Uncharacterized protein n=1 Tax=Portunus trituberculatus TaxID=210409 RepID=A0A5B7CV47_PORTR|nr:hypothetical protein [Portunus trituberculatus]